MPSISLLIERDLSFKQDKIVAASRDRNLLVEKARDRNLHIDAAALNRSGTAKIDEFHQAVIEDIEILEHPKTFVEAHPVIES